MGGSGRAVAILAAIVSLLVGCSRVLSQPFTGPESGGPPWLELTSAHFSLRTDLTESDAKSSIEELETLHTALHDLVFPYEQAPQFRMRAVHFRRAAEFNDFRPHDLSAAYFHSARIDEDVEPALVLYGDMTEEVRRKLAHELTHGFVHFYYPKAPIWFNEGIAEYCSTLEVEGGTATLGRPAHVFRGGISWGRLASAGKTYGVVPSGAVPTVAELVAMTQADFYDTKAAKDSPAQREEHEKRVTARYAGAWALVDLLKNGPDVYRAHFDAFVAALARGSNGAAAWASAFGSVDPQRLEADFRAWLTAIERTLLRTKYEAHAAAIEKQRTLAPAEVHVLWAELRSVDTDAGRAKARADVEAALRLDPRSAPAKVQKARLDVAEHRLDDAERTLEDAVAASQDEASLYALFRVRVERALLAGGAPEAWAQTDTMVPALLARLSTPRRQNGVARYLAMRGRTPEADALARRAIQTDAGCSACFDTYAMVLADEGATADAVDAESVSLALLSHDDHDDGASARLEAFRLRAEARGGLANVLAALSKSTLGTSLHIAGLEAMPANGAAPTTRVSLSLRDETGGELAGAAGVVLVDGKLARVILGRGHPYYPSERHADPIFEADLPRGPHDIEIRYALDRGGYAIFGLASSRRVVIDSRAHFELGADPLQAELALVSRGVGGGRLWVAIRWPGQNASAP